MIAHWLPCKIDADGANVSLDLHKSASVQNDEPNLISNNPILSFNIRGRPVRGAQLELPSNYRPVMIDQLIGSDLDENEVEPLRLGSVLDDMYLWNLSSQPKPTDPIPLSMSWLHLANVLHKDDED